MKSLRNWLLAAAIVAALAAAIAGIYYFKYGRSVTPQSLLASLPAKDGVLAYLDIHALRAAGCTHVLASTAVGSLREEIRRGDFVILDQFIDFTRQRRMTFHESFAPHAPAHTPMADPFSAPLRQALLAACRELGMAHHERGTVVTIEGPRFSTRAESRMFRLWGADVINMSVATEAILANEAGLPYAAVAMSTDYDCWKTDEEPVSWDAILAVFQSNAKKMTDLLCHAIPRI